MLRRPRKASFLMALGALGFRAETVYYRRRKGERVPEAMTSENLTSENHLLRKSMTEEDEHGSAGIDRAYRRLNQQSAKA